MASYDFGAKEVCFCIFNGSMAISDKSACHDCSMHIESQKSESGEKREDAL
jgi:hypothetical protein